MRTELIDKHVALLTKIPEWLKDAGFEATVAMQGYIGKELGETNVSKSYAEGKSDSVFDDAETTWSKMNRLRNRSGLLLKSFNPKHPRSASEVKLSGYRLGIKIGSNLPYAEVHEKGMAVMSKGRMHKYFWAKYISSRNEFYRIMALSVLKRGGIRIRPRPYFAKALRRFEQEYINKWLAELLEKIVRFIG